MKRTIFYLLAFGSIILSSFTTSTAVVYAQEETQNLNISTNYPGFVAELGESVNLSIKLSVNSNPETINLLIGSMPSGWTATFRGGGKIINSVFVEPGSPASIDLRLDPPQDQKSGIHSFTVIAQGKNQKVELPITITIQEKVPANLVLESDLPIIKGTPTTVFRYNATLKNEGDQEITVNLTADVPKGFIVKYKLSGQEVTSFPIDANQSKTINIELNPLIEIPAGSYPFIIFASGGDLQAQLDLVAEVTGQHELSITGLDGRLSAKANAGRTTSIQLLLKNAGTASAQGVELSANLPSGWTITFDPETIAEIQPGEQMEITATLNPSEKAIAGDYMITVNARPVDGLTKSSEFRITVTTSTLWGIAGIGLIAVAVIVVAMAVGRFGRR
jgi:uncharacterized membrane protein